MSTESLFFFFFFFLFFFLSFFSSPIGNIPLLDISLIVLSFLFPIARISGAEAGSVSRRDRDCSRPPATLHHSQKQRVPDQPAICHSVRLRQTCMNCVQGVKDKKDRATNEVA